MIDILLKIYRGVVFFLGNATLILIFVTYGVKIYQHFKMKKITKEYAEKIHKSNFLYDALGKMTDEEKERLKKDPKSSTKVTLDFNDVSVKKEIK